MPMANYKPELQEEVRTRLNRYADKGVKLTKFAELSNINYMTLYCFANGERNLSEEKLEGLVKALNEYEQD